MAQVSSVTTVREAWQNLERVYVGKTRTRVMALKEKLILNPQGTRSMSDYL